jgi:hypothetical protein
MELKYTYWQEKDGWFLGYLNDINEILAGVIIKNLS